MGELEFETEFEERFEAALTSAAPDVVARPNISSTAMACTFLDRDNRKVWTDPRLDQWIGLDNIDLDICDKVRVSGNGEVVQTVDPEDRPMLMIYAPMETALHWPIPLDLTSSTIRKQDAVAVGALSLAHLSDDIEHAAKAFGMTNLEARVSSALVAQGSMRRAAEQCGVTYNTARKAAAEAMRKTGLSSQTHLVRRLSELATSVIPPREVAERLLIDTFGFNLREARLTLLLAEGQNRKQSAKIAGLSEAVAKDVFSRIFETLGIAKAPEIPRIIMDVFMVAMLGNADRRAISSFPGGRQPLQLIARPDGSLIAVSDYGPPEGKPVLVLHSSLSTRHPFFRLVEELHSAGFRPITIDRPGFGMSDPLPSKEDAFATGADDVKIVFERLDIEKADMVTRGGAFAALAIARHYRELVGQVVVMNPDLLQEQCSSRKGNLGIIRTGFDRFPNRVDRIAQWVGRQLTPDRTASIIRMAVKNSPVDLKLFENERNLADYQRSILAFATGRLSGLIREQKGYTLQKDVDPLTDGSHWTIILGGDDPIHDVGEILTVWRPIVPGAKIQHVENAGRFIELSHAAIVVQALTDTPSK